MKFRYLAVVLSLALFVGACGKNPPQLPASVPAAIVVTDANINQAVVGSLRVMKAAGEVLETASKMESDSFVSGGVPADVHAKLRAGFQAAAKVSLSAIDKLESGAVKTWPELKAEIDKVLAAINPLAQAVFEAGGGVRDRILAYIRLVSESVSTLLQYTFTPAPAVR
jgi:hypothetical protein